jgi:Spy/CpxP family protein refolding chaperone
VKVAACAMMVAALCLACVAAPPQKSSPPAAVFFKATGEPFELEKPFPGITAALMLTNEQKIALSEAHRQTVRNPELRNKIAALKSKDNPIEAQREAVRKELESAQAALRARVDAILTPEQKTLAAKIEVAVIDAEHEANQIFEGELAAAKDDPLKTTEVREKARVEAEDLIVQKLEKFLTPTQMQAMQQAATQQRAALEERKKKLR